MNYNELTNEVQAETVEYQGLLKQHRTLVSAMRDLDRAIHVHNQQLETAHTRLEQYQADYEQLLEAIEAARAQLQADVADTLDAHYQLDDTYER